MLQPLGEFEFQQNDSPGDPVTWVANYTPADTPSPKGEPGASVAYLYIYADANKSMAIPFPPGVVLAQEVDAPADPFMPDWSAAPTWARWHAFDHDGGGNWFDSQPKASGSVWDTALPYDFSGNTIFLSGLDWRNSLRHRPNEA